MKVRGFSRNSIALAALAYLSLPCASIAAGADKLDLQPGTWRITQFTETPFFNSPPATLDTTCISAANPDPLDVLVKTPCVVDTRTIRDGALIWKSTCVHPASPKPFRGKGRIVGSGKVLRGMMTVRLEVGGNTFVIQYDISGRRAGECPQ